MLNVKKKKKKLDVLELEYENVIKIRNNDLTTVDQLWFHFKNTVD